MASRCVKYENMKERSLYPTDIICYAHESYVLNNIEDTFNN